MKGIQEELTARNADQSVGRRMEFRIGVNLGDVIVEGGRTYGDGVNIAARVQELAEGGGVCISGSVCGEIPSKLSLDCESIGEHTLKNIDEPVHVYRVRAAARNSTFTYKNRAVKISDVGRELGVRYVLEGSVRKVGDEEAARA